MGRSIHFVLSGYNHLIVNLHCIEVRLDHLTEVNLLILVINLNTENCTFLFFIIFFNPYQD